MWQHAAEHLEHMLSRQQGIDYSDATVEGVAALRVDQAKLAKKIERIALSGEMPAQASAGSIADAQFFEESGVVHAPSA